MITTSHPIFLCHIVNTLLIYHFSSVVFDSCFLGILLLFAFELSLLCIFDGFLLITASVMTLGVPTLFKETIFLLVVGFLFCLECDIGFCVGGDVG